MVSVWNIPIALKWLWLQIGMIFKNFDLPLNIEVFMRESTFSKKIEQSWEIYDHQLYVLEAYYISHVSMYINY